MYNNFRTDFISELSDRVSEEVITIVLDALDKTALSYDVSEKKTSIIPSAYEIPEEVKRFLVTKSVERYSDLTLKNYARFLNLFFRMTQKTLKDITMDDITYFLYWYKNRNGKQIKDSSLNKVLDCLKSFFTWCYDRGYIDKDPSHAIRNIKCEKEEVPPLTEAELEKVRRAARTPREIAIVETFYSTGCRVSELCGMKKEDLNVEKKTVHIFGKGRKHRTGFLNVRSLFAIQDYLAGRDDNDEHLFVSERNPHKGLTKAAVEKVIRNLGKRAGLEKKLTCHMFRHTIATIMLDRGAAIQEIQIMLGHEQITTTMRYAKVNVSHVQETHHRLAI